MPILSSGQRTRKNQRKKERKEEEDPDDEDDDEQEERRRRQVRRRCDGDNCNDEDEDDEDEDDEDEDDGDILANSTLIILFSEMLKFSKIIGSKSKDIVKENEEYLGIYSIWWNEHFKIN